MRPPLDRDFMRTKEDLIFCVVGYMHPPASVTAYLKYLPSSDGKWSDGEKRYARAFPYYHARKISETMDFLKAHYPHYVSFCPVRNMELSMIPDESVSCYYLPEERMREIHEKREDALEKDVFEFIDFLSESAGLSWKDFGVTGSTLTKMHNPSFSDMDILVYGLSQSLKLREALGGPSHPALKKKEGEKERWAKTRSSHFPISTKLAEYYFERRWNFGHFKERYFSLHPTRRPEEVKEKYGEMTHRKLGDVRLRAVVSDAHESIFLPATYGIEDAEILEGRWESISEIISYEGLYCDVADAGDTIEACGALEASDGKFSVVIGTRTTGDEWIRVMK